MNKRAILLLKIALVAAVVATLGYQFHKAWRNVADQHIAIDWRFSALGLLGFAGSMLTSALVWRWLAWKMRDRSPTLPLLGAYTFSQMGKYIPGKVVLLLMRIERAGRFGMQPSVCTLSTILENGLYMISGALVGLLAIMHISAGLSHNQQILVWTASILAILVLGAACHPRIFYGLINQLLLRMKKPQVPASRQLPMRLLVVAVVGFFPCWFFGGLALWAAGCCVDPQLAASDIPWLAGAYGLSVIVGMASFLPAGLAIRESVMIAALVIPFSAHMPQADAWLRAGIAAGLARVFQIVVEALLGVAGAGLTSLPAQAKPVAPPPA
jgi:hypothetical protein